MESVTSATVVVLCGTLRATEQEEVVEVEVE